MITKNEKNKKNDRAPMVSIIVPIYNAEEYLHRCVDSILNQEYTDFELLLVDDGSTDGSGAICDAYATEDARVRVIHKANSGVSDSRNLAIDQAQGKYLQFLDSDDWITPDATRLFVRAAEEYHCDMVISDFYRVVGERVSPKGDIEQDGVLTREEFAENMMENPADFYYGVLWNKLYKRDLIEEHTLRMDTAISWCEDFLFNLEYLRFAESFYALHAPIYYYVKRKGSLVTQGNSISKTVKMKLNVFEYYNNFYKHLWDEEDYEKNRLQVYRFFLDSASDGMVPPVLLAGTKKLGDERNFVNAQALLAEGISGEFYANRKFLEHYLEPVALKAELKVVDVRVLLCLCGHSVFEDREKLADFVGLTKRSLSLSLQRLASRGIVKVEEGKPSRTEKGDARSAEDRRGRERKHAEAAMSAAGTGSVEKELRRREFAVRLLPTGEGILHELDIARRDYEAARFADFSDEERADYARLHEKLKENVRRVLG